jgi:2-C-methyl-D-erythritol 2,4-cyclodiphosphate synthase
VIGGVHVPYERGLDGHSDADVLLHAIGDAILGALALGDLGATSRTAIRAGRMPTAARCSSHRRADGERGFAIGNVDATVIAQAPRLAPHVAAMRANVASDLGCTPDDVGIKATTTEHLGFAGRGEGIAAMASVPAGRPRPAPT